MRIGDEYNGGIFISEQSGPDFKITVGDESLSSEIK